MNKNIKIELFVDILEEFPQKADFIINKAEEICKKNSNFSKFTEEEKTDFVLNTIFENDDLIDDELHLLLDVKNFLKFSKKDFLTGEILEKIGSVNLNQFFAISNFIQETKVSDYKQLTKVFEDKLDFYNNKDKLEFLSNLIFQTIEIIENLIIEVSEVINENIYLLKKLFNLNSNEINKIKFELKKNYTKLIDNIDRLAEISKELHQKVKTVEKRLIEVNYNQIQNNFNENINFANKEIQKIIFKLDELTKITSQIDLSIDKTNLLVLLDYIKKYSEYFENYLIITSLISANDIYKFDNENIKLLDKYEKKFLSSKDLFFNIIKNIINKQINSNISNKKNEFYKNFVEPIKNNLDENSFKTLDNLLKIIF